MDLSQIAADLMAYAKADPLPVAAAALLFLFFLHRYPKKMLKGVVAVGILLFAVHTVSGLMDSGGGLQDAAYNKSIKIMERDG